MNKATISIGKISLDVDYMIDAGQKSDSVHMPEIPPSVEIFKVKFKDIEILDLLNEIDSDDFSLKIESLLLTQ